MNGNQFASNLFFTYVYSMLPHFYPLGPFFVTTPCAKNREMKARSEESPINFRHDEKLGFYGSMLALLSSEGCDKKEK